MRFIILAVLFTQTLFASDYTEAAYPDVGLDIRHRGHSHSPKYCDCAHAPKDTAVNIPCDCGYFFPTSMKEDEYEKVEDASCYILEKAACCLRALIWCCCPCSLWGF